MPWSSESGRYWGRIGGKLCKQMLGHEHYVNAGKRTAETHDHAYYVAIGRKGAAARAANKLREAGNGVES